LAAEDPWSSPDTVPTSVVNLDQTLGDPGDDELHRVQVTDDCDGAEFDPDLVDAAARSPDVNDSDVVDGETENGDGDLRLGGRDPVPVHRSALRGRSDLG
jgi:hypothetical protein